jgi:hypothetical protein
MKIIVILGLLSLCLSACSSSPTDSNCNCFSLQVTVLDTLSQPVPALSVSMWNQLEGVVPVRHNTGSSSPAAKPPPSSYALYQNYPNPFNGQTVVRLALPVFGDFTVDFLDVTGRPVDQFRRDSAEAGIHSVDWSPPVTTSAVYTYRLRAYLNDTLEFTDSAYAVCWYADAAHNEIGFTDLAGVLTSRDSLRFPSLVDLPDMVQTDAVSPDTVGLFRVSDSIFIVLTDVGSGRSQEYRRTIGKGSNSYTLRWDPGP